MPLLLMWYYQNGGHPNGLRWQVNRWQVDRWEGVVSRTLALLLAAPSLALLPRHSKLSCSRSPAVASRAPPLVAQEGRLRQALQGSDEIDSEIMLDPERFEEEITSYVFERQRDSMQSRRKSS